MEISPVGPNDLAALPSELGQREFFADRFARQERGLGTLVAAWDGGRPVGVFYLWLEPAEEREIRTHLDGVPLLTHLRVMDEEQGRGVGTMLINEAEGRARAHGSDRIALAVPTDKTATAERYLRLGYRVWEHGEVLCLTEEWLPDGSRVREPERCHVFVKRLSDTD